MTAEVAILNAHAAVLAADSAVRFTFTNENTRTYTTATKIYPLTDTYPVAVMFYGADHYAGVPWDTLIKLYRPHLTRPLPTVAEHAQHFLNWLVHDLEQTYQALSKYRRHTPTHDRTALNAGAVFAGYGANQLLPAITTYRIDTPLENGVPHPELQTDQTGAIENPKRSCLVTFGTPDPMDTMLTRISIDLYNDTIEKYIRDAVMGELLDNDTIRNQADTLATNIVRHVEQRTETYIVRQIQRISEAVATLSTGALAHVAESLVNFAAIHQQIRTNHITVASPVDVAVITRGDGFTWAKCKPSFGPERSLR